ncbi:MAG: hypothetical protein KF773_18580 [Deltaproteobacteria bacterium]|nr:hypothetical protein [Deltaproteobacteria bacterium]MCW5804702.1 hypothetical protein [Deltaproteobacteria bacterium]
MLRPAAALPALVAAALTGPRTARAETEQALSGGFGFATFSAPGKAVDNMPPPSVSPDWGLAIAGTYERSLGSDLALRAELAAGLFRGGAAKDQSLTSFAGLADAGIAIRFDVSNAVPYAFVGLGGVVSGGGPIERGADFVLVAGGGLDYLTQRRRSYGGEIRLASFAGDVTVVTFNLRITSRWGL